MFALQGMWDGAGDSVYRRRRCGVTASQALMDWQIAEGINLLVPCGSTGEAQTMSDGSATGRGRRRREDRRASTGDGGRHEQ